MNISWCVLLLLAWTQLARAYGTPNYIAMPEHWRVYNREQTAEQTATQSISRSSTARSGSLAAVDRTAAGPAQTVASQTIDWTALSRTGNSSGNSSKFDPPYTVCVGQWTPMTTCTADSTQDEYTGEQQGNVEVLAMGAALLPRVTAVKRSVAVQGQDATNMPMSLACMTLQLWREQSCNRCSDACWHRLHCRVVSCVGSPDWMGQGRLCFQLQSGPG